METSTKPTFLDIIIFVVIVVLVVGLVGGCIKFCCQSKPSPQAIALIEDVAIQSIDKHRFTVTRIPTETAQVMYLIKDNQTNYEFIYISGSGVTRIQ